jgi:hypothetical protein
MPEHEFSSKQNAAINSLREKILHISLLHFSVAGLLLWNSFMGTVQPRAVAMSFSGIAVTIFVVLGVLFLRPLNNLKRVVTTAGEDITQMMIAMDDLRIAYAAAAIVYAVASLTLAGWVSILIMR